MKPNGSKNDALTRSETTCRTSFSSRIGRQGSVGVRWGLCWGTRDVCKPFRQGLDIFKKMRIWINRMWRLSGLSGIEDVLALAIPAFRFQDISPSVTSSKMLYAGLPSPIRVPGARSVMNQPLAKTQECFHASHAMKKMVKWRVYGKLRQSTVNCRTAPLSFENWCWASALAQDANVFNNSCLQNNCFNNLCHCGLRKYAMSGQIPARAAAEVTGGASGVWCCKVVGVLGNGYQWYRSWWVDFLAGYICSVLISWRAESRKYPRTIHLVYGSCRICHLANAFLIPLSANKGSRSRSTMEVINDHGEANMKSFGKYKMSWALQHDSISSTGHWSYLLGNQTMDPALTSELNRTRFVQQQSLLTGDTGIHSLDHATCPDRRGRVALGAISC